MKQNPCTYRTEKTTDVWLTPKYIFDDLGEYDLDPCGAPIPRPFETARKVVCLPENGLEINWSGRVWVNPPYRDVREWIEKGLGEIENGAKLTYLVFSRTGSKYWQDLIFKKANAIFFLRDRLRFLNRNGAEIDRSGVPSALIFFNEYRYPKKLNGSLVVLKGGDNDATEHLQ